MTMPTVLFSLTVDRSRSNAIASIGSREHFHRIVGEFLESVENSFAAGRNLGVLSLLVYNTCKTKFKQQLVKRSII